MEGFKLASVRGISLHGSVRAKAEQIVGSKGQLGRFQGSWWTSNLKGEPAAGSRRPDSGPWSIVCRCDITHHYMPVL
jgi:hypothetical protein